MSTISHVHYVQPSLALKTHTTNMTVMFTVTSIIQLDLRQNVLDATVRF